MMYFLKKGDLKELQQIFWARVGTSGGIGLPPGSVVLSSEALMVDMRPYRLFRGVTDTCWFDGTFPADVRKAIFDANPEVSYPIVEGCTVTANDFFLEQFRIDGAICKESAESKSAWLNWLHENGVRNIEMEGAVLLKFKLSD